jgi:hypothetical protein
VGPRALSAGTLEKGLVLSSDLRENPLILDNLNLLEHTTRVIDPPPSKLL